MLAKTDFKLRYQGSVLGYVWALLKPLLMFSVLYFVFTSIFNFRSDGTDYYALELLIGLMMFNFFSEGTNAGMSSLLNKSQLVNKIYVPRWTIILASTINSAMIYLVNILIIILFFFFFHYAPSLHTILLFLLFSIGLSVLIISFSFFSAPLFAYFRDLSLIWEVVLQVMFFATPIMYPLSLMPAEYHKYLLLNPLAFIVHFTKESISSDRLPDTSQIFLFVGIVTLSFVIGIFTYRKMIPSIAEKI